VSTLFVEFLADLAHVNIRLSDLVATISRKPIPDHAKNLILEITAEDTAEEDVEVPYVRVNLAK
jgi:ubiquitin-activating enzyme E1